MPLFDVKIVFGPVTSLQEQTLTAAAFRVDQNGPQDSSCLYGVFDEQATMHVMLDCYDADSAKLNALYAVRAELQNTEFADVLNPENYTELECQQIQ